TQLAVRRFVIKGPDEKASLSCTDPIGGGKLSSLPPNVPCSAQLAVDVWLFYPHRLLLDTYQDRSKILANGNVRR
ncbi:11758_t:CDS:1, partial [Gigaspora rosea]